MSSFSLAISKQKKIVEMVPIPVVFSSNDTGIGIGGSLICLFKKDEKADSDMLSVFGVQTTKNQSIFALSFEKFLIKNYKYKTVVHYKEFPFDYYGTGIDTQYINQEKIKPSEIGLKFSLLKKLQNTKNTYFGPAFELHNYKILDYKQNGIFDNQSFNKKAFLAGFGFEFEFDSRDLKFYPRNGSYLNFLILNYTDKIVSDNSFIRQELDYKFFKEIYKNFIWASQYNFKFSQGDYVFLDLNNIDVRGIESHRFIEKNSINLVQELRFPIRKKFKGNIFFGAGNVASELDKFVLEKTKIGYGFGIRYCIFQKMDINLAMDFALNNILDDDKTIYFYFKAMEFF
jgi:hypothetical protein